MGRRREGEGTDGEGVAACEVYGDCAADGLAVEYLGCGVVRRVGMDLWLEELTMGVLDSIGWEVMYSRPACASILMPRAGCVEGGGMNG